MNSGDLALGPSTRQLRGAIHEYLDAHNEDPKPFRWTKTADEILESIARFARAPSSRIGSPDFA